jgi:hypothetical protein
MFDWFKNKKTPSNVIPFPDHRDYGVDDKNALPLPEVEPPKKPPVTYYTLGITNEGRLEMKIGYSGITMNYGGCCNLIEQLEVFKQQLAEYEGIENNE